MPCYGGPIHARHIFGEGDISSIVKTSLPGHRTKAQVISPGSGRPFTASDATELFKQIITYLLTEEVCWESAVEYVAEWARGHGGNQYQICAFRSSQQVRDVAIALQAETGQELVPTEDLMAWLFALPLQVKPSSPLQSKVAIIGMACRFPGGATNSDKYWDLFESGRDVYQKIPADRFNVETHFDPTGQKVNATQTPYGCFVEEPGLFDPAFFNMSPREAEQTDPMHRLALVTAYEALERAGFVAGKSVDMHRIGTFYGQSSDDYREVNSGQEIGTYWIPVGCRAFSPGRINYFFGFGGPSFSCDTACSSSLAAIQMSCTSLWSGDTDMVVAGGMNILTNPDGFAGLSKGFFLSNTGNCKTWDSLADGYCRADGVGSVVMKRLEDALADNDNILGVIAAAATNHSAEAISITHPNSDAQSYLFRQVIGRAGIDPLDVCYVELHGTGTQAGDSNELRSVTDVFAPSKQGRSAEQPLFISAAKANVGHGEAAAGIMSLIKTLCVLQREEIPPHVGIKNELTPSFPQDADKRNIRIPYRTTPWPRSPERKRIAIVNNFGAAGGNTSLVIEEGPERQIQKTDPRSTHVLVVSAKNAVSLERNIERLLSYIRNNPEVALQDLAYTLTARKAHYSHRVGFAVSEVFHFEKLYSSYLATNAPLQCVLGTRPPLAFAFTGQGSFYSSMASQLFKDSPPFRSCILHLDRLCQRQGFDSILPAIDGQSETGHKFSLATYHLAILCIEMALSSLWEQLGVNPDIVVGHSLGEFAAFHAAGVLSASDTIFLVGQRARLLERLTEAGTSGMVAVHATPEKVKKSIGENTCHIACINGPEDLVLAGTTEALSSAAGLLRSDGYKTLLLDISHGFHSPQMDIILNDYERVAEAAVFHKPKLPVISPLLSQVVQERGIINAQYVRRATREAVDFMGALQAAEGSSYINEKTIWLELGTHPLCCGFVRSSIRNASLTLPSLCRNKSDWATLSQTLCELHCAGVEIDWKEFHRPYDKALRLLDLPTYAWNDRNYWIPYKGDWTLTKGNISVSQTDSAEKTSPKLPPDLRTSSIHGLIEEAFDDHSVKLVVESNILDPDILPAVNGHAMNSFGVVSCVSYLRDHPTITVKSLLNSNIDGSRRDRIYHG
jgi:monodictyphenone polyketide synthase